MPHRAPWLQEFALAKMSFMNFLFTRLISYLFEIQLIIMRDFFFQKKMQRTVISSLASETHLYSDHSETYVKLFWKQKVFVCVL